MRILSMRERAGVVPEGAVYVGRDVARVGLARSPYANPYRVRGDDGRELALTLFRQHLRECPALCAQIRRELAGKVLVCWCYEGNPAPGVDVCHADVVARVADGGAP